MGQQQAKQQASFDPHQYIILKTDPETGIATIQAKHQHPNKPNTFFLKELTFTSKEQLAPYLSKYNLRTSIQHENIVQLLQCQTISETSFCSTFVKLFAVYEYLSCSLANEIEVRISNNKCFEERQIWSVLCCAVLGISHLKSKTSQEQDLVLSIFDIFLTQEGNVKIADWKNNGGSGLVHETLKPWVDETSVPEPIQALRRIVIQMATLNSNTTEDFEITRLGYSEDLQEMTHRMKKGEFQDISELEQELFRLSEVCASLQESQQKIPEDSHTDIMAMSVRVSLPKIQKHILLAPMEPEQQDEPDLTHHLVPTPVPEPQNIDLTAEEEESAQKIDGNVSSLDGESLQVFHPNLNGSFQQKVRSSNMLLNVPHTLSVHDKQNSAFLANSNIPEKNAKELFTDPKLLQLLKSDVRLSSDLKKQESPATQYSRHHNQISVKDGRKNSILSNHSIVSVNQVPRNRSNHSLASQGTTNRDRLTSIPFTNSENPVATHVHTIQRRNRANTISTPDISHQPVLVKQTCPRGIFQGYKVGNFRHGEGTFWYIEGGKYSGNWDHGSMHGKGTLFYANGKIAYQGDWERDKLSGLGVLYNEQPKRLNRPYSYESFEEVEQYWTKYEGYFKDDSKSGFGKLFLSNGQVFEGWFEDDEINGQGTFTTKNKNAVRGVWKNNRLVRTL